MFSSANALMKLDPIWCQRNIVKEQCRFGHVQPHERESRNVFTDIHTKSAVPSTVWTPSRITMPPCVSKLILLQNFLSYWSSNSSICNHHLLTSIISTNLQGMIFIYLHVVLSLTFYTVLVTQCNCNTIHSCGMVAKLLSGHVKRSSVWWTRTVITKTGLDHSASMYCITIVLWYSFLQFYNYLFVFPAWIWGFPTITTKKNKGDFICLLKLETYIFVLVSLRDDTVCCLSHRKFGFRVVYCSNWICTMYYWNILSMCNDLLASLHLLELVWFLHFGYSFSPRLNALTVIYIFLCRCETGNIWQGLVFVDEDLVLKAVLSAYSTWKDIRYFWMTYRRGPRYILHMAFRKPRAISRLYCSNAKWRFCLACTMVPVLKK